MNLTSTSDPKKQSPRTITDEVFVQQFTVPYEYAVHFTEDLFNTDNKVFRQILTSQSEPGQRRLLIFIDAGVVTAIPSLCESINQFVKVHQSCIDLVTNPIVIAAGEALKSDSSMLSHLQEIVASHKMDRHSYIAAIGGGALLDTIGLVAATAHRGIRHIRIPTTVLAQNDSGVGVKNGVNLFGQKNYLGAFAPPYAVVNDYAFIEALPARDKIAGMAEAVKVALIRDAPFFHWLESNVEKLAEFDKFAIQYMIKRCAELHLHQIAHGGDPFETGSARPLDFGHWSAHKLEAISAFKLRHGEAVAIGIALDTRYSVLENFLDKGADRRVCDLLQALGFSLWHPALESANAEDQLRLLQGLEEFREHLGGQLTITLLEAIGAGIEVHSMNPVTVCKSIAWLKEKESAATICARRLRSAPSQNIIDLSARRKLQDNDKAVFHESAKISVSERLGFSGPDVVSRHPSPAAAHHANTGIKQSHPVNLSNLQAPSHESPERPPDTDAACTFLIEHLSRQLSNKHFSWFLNRLERLDKTPEDRDLFITLGMIPRKLGREDLNITATDIVVAQSAAGVAWNPQGWSIDNAARCVVLGKLLLLQPDRFDDIFSELCQSAELNESIAFFRCTALLPQSEPTDNAISGGLRTHIRAIFEAISHRNPYPFLHFDTNKWNHMVLKALFIDSTLWQIHGIDIRANNELARMLVDYAHERWAANRSVSPELWRCVGPFATDSIINDIERALHSKNTQESLGGLMALLDCPHVDHSQLRRLYPGCCNQIDKGVMNWERLGRHITDGN